MDKFLFRLMHQQISVSFYNIRVTDTDGGVAYTGSNLTTTAVSITNLVDSTTYNVAIYAGNGVDTLYNMYNVDAMPIPSPVPVDTLSWNSSDSVQLSVSFHYPSA